MALDPPAPRIGARPPEQREGVVQRIAERAAAPLQLEQDILERHDRPCLGSTSPAEHAVEQGHGRLLPSTVFVGWNGSVHLLAYSPSPGSSRSDDLVAPELRASERLLSPAADVYAVAALLRLLLPPAAAARPAISRLLRRCLHAQADQRMSLSTLHNALGTLLLDLGAPLRRAAAIGEVLGRFCPRAAVDLLKRNREPNEHQVREWLEGNICRCTGYHNIVKAVLSCAAATKEGAA